jgi:ATPase subunit of ABC transporter with duplicated ATPase domains
MVLLVPEGIVSRMLQIESLVFNAWGRRFFDKASVSLPNPSKVGLVGRNGVGKSTLFKLIKGELQPDSGEIGIPKTARMATVDQEHPATAVSLLETILAADVERASLYAELESAEPERMGDIWSRLIEIDADGRVLRWLAHAGGARGGFVLSAGLAAAGRADQLSRPRGRSVARGQAGALSAFGADHQP